MTGSGLVNALEGNGLGIVGGPSSLVDGSESILFTFNDGPAINVSYFLPFISNTDRDSLSGERSLEAFDADGNSLGTIGQSGFGTGVSSLFGGQAISAFSLTSSGVDGFRVGSVTYTTAPPPAVPLPAGLPLALAGIAPFGLLRLRKKKAG